MEKTYRAKDLYVANICKVRGFSVGENGKVNDVKADKFIGKLLAVKNGDNTCTALVENDTFRDFESVCQDKYMGETLFCEKLSVAYPHVIGLLEHSGETLLNMRQIKVIESTIKAMERSEVRVDLSKDEPFVK